MESNLFILVDRSTPSIRASVRTAGSYGALVVNLVDSYGFELESMTSELKAQKITEDTVNDIIYIGKAAIGAAQVSAIWQCKKITTSGSDTVTEWADGNSNYDNVATDLTTLNYS